MSTGGGKSELRAIRPQQAVLNSQCVGQTRYVNRCQADQLFGCFETIDLKYQMLFGSFRIIRPDHQFAMSFLGMPEEMPRTRIRCFELKWDLVLDATIAAEGRLAQKNILLATGCSNPTAQGR